MNMYFEQICKESSSKYSIKDTDRIPCGEMAGLKTASRHNKETLFRSDYSLAP